MLLLHLPLTLATHTPLVQGNTVLHTPLLLTTKPLFLGRVESNLPIARNIQIFLGMSHVPPFASIQRMWLGSIPGRSLKAPSFTTTGCFTAWDPNTPKLLGKR